VALLVTSVATARQAGTRTVYVSVVTGKNVPVTEMAAGEFVIKEDGKVRAIAKAERAIAPMQIALMLDDGGLSLNAIRQGAGRFIQTLQGKREFSIVTIGARNLTLVDFTTDVPRLYAGLQKLLPRSTVATYLLDGFLAVVKGFQRRDAQRPIIVVVAGEGEELSDVRAPVVLEAFEKSGAKLYYIGLGFPVTQGNRPGPDRPESSTEYETANRNAVLGAAPKNSGGRSEQVLQPNGVPVLMKQFAEELAAQYAITYEVGKSGAKLSFETTRKGISVRGPLRRQ
jgi:VWFA-related protein